MIPKAGPRLKFYAKLQEYFKNSSQNSDIESATNSLSEENCSQNNIDEVVCEADVCGSEARTHEGKREIGKLNFDIGNLVHKKLPEIYKKMNEGVSPSLLEKYKLNRLIVDTFAEKNGCQPRTMEKKGLAIAIVSTFPVLKGKDGEGTVSIVVVICFLSTRLGFEVCNLNFLVVGFVAQTSTLGKQWSYSTSNERNMHFSMYTQIHF